MFAGINYFIKVCWKYDRAYLIYLSINQLLKIGLVITNLYFPKLILDAFFTQNDLDIAKQRIVIYLLIVLVVGIVINIVSCLSNNARTSIFHCFQLHLAKHMANIKLSMLESERFLSLKAKAQQFLYGGGKGFASILETSFEIFGDIVSLILYIILIYRLNWIMLLFLAIVILVNTLFYWRYRKNSIKINMEKSKEERRCDYYSTLFQDYKYGKEVRVNDLCDWLISKYDKQLKKMQQFYASLNRNNCVFSQISLILSTLQQLITYAYLFLTVMKHQLTVGEFSLYLNVIYSSGVVLKKVVLQLVDVQQYTIYFDAYKEYLGKTCEEDIKTVTNVEDMLRDDGKYYITFNNVSFIYPQNNYYSLKNVNVTIGMGDKIAIVGKNGAGKSTFIKLLLRIYHPTEGEILLNGINIDEIDEKKYLKLFSTVFQDYILFAETLKDNIILNNNADTQKLKDILMKIKLMDRINGLPNKWNTSIYKLFDNYGYIPSMGEMQKIAIARAAYRSAPIVILDEPSSSMDPQSEYELYHLFNELRDGKTCLFISHRLAITFFSNRILVFNDAEIEEEGSHDELIRKRGLYYEMFKKQSKYYDI